MVACYYTALTCKTRLVKTSCKIVAKAGFETGLVKHYTKIVWLQGLLLVIVVNVIIMVIMVFVFIMVILFIVVIMVIVGVMVIMVNMFIMIILKL